MTEFKPVVYKWLDGNLDAADPALPYKPIETPVIAQPPKDHGYNPSGSLAFSGMCWATGVSVINRVSGFYYRCTAALGSRDSD